MLHWIETGDWILPAALLSSGLAAGCLIRGLLGSVGGVSDEGRSHYESLRRMSMRNESWVYRTFEATAVAMASTLDARRDAEESRLQRALRSQKRWQAWNAREFIATKLIEGILVGASVSLLVGFTGVWSLGMLLGGGLFVTYPFLSQQSLLTSFEKRLKRQRLRLPFVIDQIALMMQAGGSFEESLRSIAMDDPQHPLTEELCTVLADITAGSNRRAAFAQWKARVPDPEVGELISAIIKGEELGTPLSSILAEQAEQMRIKRSQWGEKAAAEAEVQIVFPGMLVMLACLIVVLGPIMLPAVMNLIGTGD